MQDVDIVLLDTKSIQQYIYSSNKLKLNLGASYIVSHIYEGDLLAALNEVVPGMADDRGILNRWKEEPDRIRILEEEIPFEAGYIGGGNAFLLFKRGLGQIFIERWTLRLLQRYPGLSVGVACVPVSVNCLRNGGSAFKETVACAFHELQRNKQEQCPVTTPAKHGITMDCSLDAEGCETWHAGDGVDNFVSASSEAKLRASGHDDEHSRYSNLLQGYEFPSELDHLGQHEGESHIAVVHVDGNSMSGRFQNCENLEELRKSSIELSKANAESFRQVLADLIDTMPELEKTGEFVSTVDDHHYLPVRPLVGEGDDRTFVSDARVALFLVEDYMRCFASHRVLGQSISSGAGIAIVKTAYPFYRAYQLAEELCNSSKDAREKWQNKLQVPKSVDSSWLDFYIAYAGLSGDLSSMRQRQYIRNGIHLHDGPYCLDTDSDGTGWPQLNTLVSGIEQFSPSISDWPRSKIKDLRTALESGKEATKAFLEDMARRELTPPGIPGVKDGCIQRTLDQKTYTSIPYFDMIELADLYPQVLLAKRAQILSGKGGRR